MTNALVAVVIGQDGGRADLEGVLRQIAVYQNDFGAIALAERNGRSAWISARPGRGRGRRRGQRRGGEIDGWQRQRSMIARSESSCAVSAVRNDMVQSWRDGSSASTSALVRWPDRAGSPCKRRESDVRAQSRRRCGRGEPSPGTDVAAANLVPVQMQKGREAVASIGIGVMAQSIA
jgi:hypothetical protein